MHRNDRILGILLLLHTSESVSAAAIAERFGVSTRTAYRDMDTLSQLGVPLYAERGRDGGFRLLEGYVMPPLMFSRNEAISLLVSLTLLDSLRAKPFPEELETATRKLLAAIPPRLRATLTEARHLIGFEATPPDIFHPEPETNEPAGADNEENQFLGDFFQAILDQRPVHLSYQSPYASQPRDVLLEPCGLFGDRDRWYLVGQTMGEAGYRLWRADRVRGLRPRSTPHPAPPRLFDVQTLLGRRWLQPAIHQWAREAPVKIRLTTRQAQRLQQDWYYRQAHYEHRAEDEVVMTFGEEDQAQVLALVRWLGPGAELLEPLAWRQVLQDELRQMTAAYSLAVISDP